MEKRMQEEMWGTWHAGVFNLNLVIYGWLRNKLSQLVLITLDRSFQMVSISFLNKVWEEKEARPVLILMLSAKQGSIWYHFITSLVWRGRGSNTRPSAHGANVLTTEPPLDSNAALKNYIFLLPSYEGLLGNKIKDMFLKIYCFVCHTSRLQWSPFIGPRREIYIMIKSSVCPFVCSSIFWWTITPKVYCLSS